MTHALFALRRKLYISSLPTPLRLLHSSPSLPPSPSHRRYSQPPAYSSSLPMIQLDASCHCGRVAFSFASAAPVPFMRCFCSICRKTAGGGGYAINIAGASDSLVVHRGQDQIKNYRAVIDKSKPDELAQNRYFCQNCASYLWAFSEAWPQWIYPYASAIDSQLEPPKAVTSIMVASAAHWADARKGAADDVPNDVCDEYPSYSLEEWHKRNGELA
ncbi:hypothetical protein GGI07_004067 [Coemansia sp. Benny D115]|nr:hypothetical protein GGI07_004067 [Coemansia sp. Benny D115]